MKKMTFYYLVLFAIFASAQTQNNYDVTAANGNGLRFWNGNDNYKIHFGNTSEYKYGPVSDYSIKMNMYGGPNRGWTWGAPDGIPIAALNSLGDFQVARNIVAMNRLGVGIVNPTQKIDVDGKIQSKGYILIDPVLGSNSDYVALYREDLAADISVVKLSIGDDTLGSFQIGYLAWNTGEWVSTFFVNNYGKIGIGTNSPDSKLTVKGKIHAEEVKIDLSVPAPDYVFKEGYQLMSLEDIRQYIKEHGHLPNVPSAKDMEENGVELGVMNMKLLEKIEELTLYMMDQEKAIQDLQVLKKENKALQEKVGSLGKMVLKLMETKN